MKIVFVNIEILRLFFVVWEDGKFVIEDLLIVLLKWDESFDLEFFEIKDDVFLKLLWYLSMI